MGRIESVVAPHSRNLRNSRLRFWQGMCLCIRRRYLLDYTGKRVLITGASGFIGSHLAEELVTCGACVRAFLHYNSRGEEGNLKYLASEIRRDIDVVYGDLTDPDAVKKAVRGATHVFHLGALIAIPYSYLHPFSFVQTNVVGTANILNACVEAGIERLVTTSTSEVYGTAISTPMDENHRLHPQSPYAASKASADHLAQSYAHSFELPVVLVRPFNTFGPRQSTRAVIPTIIMQALRNGRIEIGATSPTRDFNYVKDIAHGFALAGDAPTEHNGEVFNLGTGIEHSVMDVIQTVSTIIGKELVVHERADRIRPAASEVHRLLADSTKAMRQFGWTPRHSFREALEHSVEWYEAYEQNITHVHTL
jgi:NAD dependent epimerase/dehydratase